MKRFRLSLLFIALLTPSLAAQPGSKPAAEQPPATPLDQASYTIGLNVGRQLKADGLNIANATMLARGIIDALTGKKPALTDAQMQAAMKDFQKAFAAEQERLAKQRQLQGTKAKQEGEAFLAENSKKPGVKILPSGLQYKVLKSGTGPSPKVTDTVKTHYHGTFINGKVFDSSVERKEPATFPVNRVIKGWTEALQLMKVGDKWQLFVPSNLAYGPDGDRQIPPSTTLIFEVELLEILK